MRRDLVEEVLAAAQEELFEDVLYMRVSGGPSMLVAQSIFGVEIAAERFEVLGERMRTGTHMTRAIKAKFPDLAKGDVINDGNAYTVLDWEPVGDGRYEIMISLKPA